MLQKKRKFDTTAFLFIAPAFILFTVFLIVPTVSSFYYSFTSWDGINPNIKFIGFDNYKEIFTSARFGNALKNTALLTVVISICENALALGLALLVDNVIKGKNLFRAIFYLPVILSGIVSGFIWKIMYSYNFGPVNKVLDMIGLSALKQDWLGNADIAIWAVAVVMIWKGAGYYMIIYLAALQGVPQDVQEAATIDGASALQRFRFITLPLISGSFTICFTLSLINGLKVFDQIAVMPDRGRGFSTETIVYLLYKSGFGEGRQGYGTAVGVVLLFIILILNNIQSAILRKREVQLNFRVSPEELALIEQKMAQLGTKNREAYLRKMALDGYVVRLELPELKELVSLMRYSSNNLNQLARRAHETGRIYDADLEDISRRQEALWDGVHQVLTQLAKLS